MATLAKKTQYGMLRTLATSTNPINTPAQVELENGPVFKGTSFGASKAATGEVVFNTGMVGYPESMTDPSYRGQILVFTHPLIGNYGVPPLEFDQYGLPKNFESDRIQVAGIIVSNISKEYSHWNAVESLASWCQREGVPAITDIDTRSLTKYLRSRGSTLGRVVGPYTERVNFVNHNKRNLVAEVSTKTVQVFNPNGDVTITVIDCGVKANILRCLASRGARVVLVPWDQDLSVINYDGLLVSNGPGDPSFCQVTVNQLREVAFKRPQPVFGICMGNLLMGLAAGGKSYKMPFGNRGHNQPAFHHETGKCVITSQNHGYAIDVSTLPPTWTANFTNINDSSNEGLAHKTLPYSSVQFHPEFRGGPEDSAFLFDSFMNSVRAVKAKLGSKSVNVSGHLLHDTLSKSQPLASYAQ